MRKEKGGLKPRAEAIRGMKNTPGQLPGGVMLRTDVF